MDTKGETVNVTRKANRWVLDWRDNGRRRRAHFHTEPEARAAAIEKARPRTQRPKPKKSALARLARQFTATKAANENYQAHVRRALDLLVRNTPPARPAELEPHHMENFFTALRPFKANTRRHYEKLARGFFRWTYRAGHTNTPPEELIPHGRTQPEPRTQTADPATTREILQAAAALKNQRGPKTDSAAIVRYVATLGLEAGMRISEMQRARASDWNRHTHCLTIRSSKNHPHRTNPVNPALAQYLDTLIARGTNALTPLTALLTRNRQPITTPTLRKHWNRARKAAGAPQINPHDLRRTWATELAEHAPLPVLMEMAGWNNPRTALFYLMNRGHAARAAAVARAWNARQHPQADTLQPGQPRERKDTVQ
jgi:integrase